MSKSIYKLKVELRDIKPTIWRELLVPSDVLLSDLHKILQITIGWTNAHLHQFKKNGEFYVPSAPGGELLGSMGKDYTGIRLNDFLQEPKDTICYEYDFGDGWQHDITLKNILPEDEEMALPVCLDGARNGPMEDSGGPWGYAHMLEILEDPSHEEYEMYAEWLPEGFDPEYFNRDEINNALKKI